MARATLAGERIFQKKFVYEKIFDNIFWVVSPYDIVKNRKFPKNFGKKLFFSKFQKNIGVLNDSASIAERIFEKYFHGKNFLVTDFWPF